MTSLKVIELNIDDKSTNYAKIYSAMLTEEFQRKRAFASLSALFALAATIEKTDNSVQKAMTLFRHPKLNEEYEISDFYVNNWHIDVRVLTNGDAVLLPKAHFDNQITPDFYAIVRINKSVDKAELLGFAEPNKIPKEALDYHYYSATLDSLISYDEFLEKISTPKKYDFAIEEHNIFKENYLSLVDDELDIQTKNSILRHLFACKDCRMEFCCFTGFEMVSCNIGKYPEIMEDDTLTIIGATDTDNEKYKGKEETISLEDSVYVEEIDKQNDNNNFQNTTIDSLSENTEDKVQEDIDDTTEQINIEPDSSDSSINPEKTTSEDNLEKPMTEREETVSDILDELFSIDEMYDKQEVEEKPVNTMPPLANPDENMEIIEDNTNQELIPINDSPYEESDFQDVEFIESSEDGNENSNDLLLESSDDDNNIEIHENIEDEDEIIEINQEELTNNKDSKKVIVDYDEKGAPVYSYITNIEDSNEPTDLNEYGEIDDDILNEKFETYSLDDDYEKDNNINNGAERPIEYYSPENASTEEEYISNNQDTDNSNENIIPDEDIIPDQNIQNTDENTGTYDTDSEAIQYNTENNEEYADDANNFEDEEYIDETDETIPDEVLSQPNSKGGLAAVILLILLGLTGFGVYKGINFIKHHASNNIEEMADNSVHELTDDEIAKINGENNTEGELLPGDDNPTNNIDSTGIPELPEQTPTTNNVEVPPLTEQDLLKAETPQIQKENKNNIASAFSANENRPSVKNINWLCTPQLFTDPAFKNYLQNLDSLLKLNLKKNILNATEKPSSNTVSYKLSVTNEGTLERISLAESSGSSQIDNIVLQSINESFEGEKSQILNDSNMKADKYYLKVVVKL